MKQEKINSWAIALNKMSRGGDGDDDGGSSGSGGGNTPG